MALLWMDGFDYLPIGTPSATINEQLSSKYTRQGNFEPFRTDSPMGIGRNSGSGIVMSNSTTFGTPSFENGMLITDPGINRTAIVGTAVKVTALPTTAGSIFAFQYAGFINAGLQLTPTGELRVYRESLNVSGLPASGFTGLIMNVGQWYYLEMKVFMDNAGSIDLNVDGVPTYSALTVDTLDVTSVYCWDAIRWYHPASGSSIYDDIYVCDGTGTTNNDFLGDVKVKTIRPNGDTLVDTGWVPSSGLTAFDKVNETGPFDTADYVAGDTTVNDQLLMDYTETDFPFITGGIFGISVESSVRTPDGESRRFNNLVRQGSTIYNGGDHIAATDVDVNGNPSFTTYADMVEVDPDTSVAWTLPGLTTAEFGLEII